MRTTRSWLLSCTALAVSSAMCGLGAPGDSAPAPAPTGLEWEQEQNLHLNKEAPTAFFASFSDLQSALKVLPENSKWRRSLNGQWKFHWAKDPQSRPADFYRQALLDFHNFLFRDGIVGQCYPSEAGTGGRRIARVNVLCQQIQRV